MAELVVVFDSATGVISVKQAGATNIADGAVVSGKLGAGAVISAAIASGQVGIPHIANLSILSAALGLAEIADPHLRSGGVNMANLASGGLMPGFLAGGPIDMGARAILTSNLSLVETGANDLSLLNRAGDARRNFLVDTLNLNGMDANATPFNWKTQNVSGAYVNYQARDEVAAALRETIRLQGGWRPYLGFPYHTSGLVSGDVFSGFVAVRLISGGLGFRLWDGAQHWTGTVALTSAT